jgi:hypothetical protein
MWLCKHINVIHYCIHIYFLMCVFIVNKCKIIKFLSNVNKYIKNINYIYNLLLINEQKIYDMRILST